VAHYLVEQKVGDWGKANGGTRVTVTDLFYCIGGKNARGVYCF
jgi:hypothetical protein